MEKICEILERSGMDLIEMSDADTGGAVTEQSERVYVVAGERGK